MILSVKNIYSISCPIDYSKIPDIYYTKDYTRLLECKSRPYLPLNLTMAKEKICTKSEIPNVAKDIAKLRQSVTKPCPKACKTQRPTRHTKLNGHIAVFSLSLLNGRKIVSTL